jgi:hypothetical protein
MFAVIFYQFAAINTLALNGYIHILLLLGIFERIAKVFSLEERE